MGGTSTGGSTDGGRAGSGGEAAGRGGAAGATDGGSAGAAGAQERGGTAGAAGAPNEAGGAGGADGIAGAAGEGGAGGLGTGGTADDGGAAGVGGAPPTHWVGTWANGPQLTEPANLPPSPGLAGNTLRQIAHVSIGGQRLRAKFSNAYGTSAIVLNSVRVAVSQGGSGILTSSDRALTFGGGSESIAIGPGSAVVSDPFDFNLAPLSDVAVTIQFGAVPSGITGHPGSRATSYLQAGNAVSAASLPSAVATEHWYILTGIDALSDSESAAIVVLGDSITDGRGSTTNGNNRWPDALARRLLANASTAKVGVLNLGIGGNSVLSGGLGPTALQRFDTDVLGQSGARWLIVLEGVNDIGGSTTAAVANQLTAAYQQFIDKARSSGLLAYGIPILPFGGSSYASAAHESARETVNTWVRTSNAFDAVIDLDAAVRDPANVANLLSMYDSGDHLHLNVAGYQKMADSVDLGLFSQ